MLDVSLQVGTIKEHLANSLLLPSISSQELADAACRSLDLCEVIDGQKKSLLMLVSAKI